MSVDLGDRTEDSLIYFMWSTNAADGASITRATDGTISVYKNDDLTQSVAGITDTEDFDSLTGIHMCKIDTSADAFYATAEDYTVVLSGATIDGKSVNAVLAVFSIENRFMRGTDNAALAATALSTATWTAARAGALTDWINGGRLDLLLDAIPTTAMRGTDGANTTVPDAAGVAATPAEVATALTDINLDHLMKIAVDTNWATTVHLDSVIGQMADVGTSATFDRTTDALEAIRDRGDAAWSAAAGNPNVLIDTTIAAVTDQTHFTLTAGSDIDDAYKDQAIVLYDASNSDYPSVRKVADYTGATKTVTLDSAPDFTIVNGDGVKTFVTAPGTTAPTVGQIRVEMEGAGYFLDLIKDDTNELQTDWVNGGRLDLLLDAIPTTAMRGTDSAALATTALSTATWTAAKAGALADWINGGRLDLLLDAIPTTAMRGTDGALTDKSGFALSATGANLILKDSTFALAMADATWDEILSGATHNIASSAGRRVREIGAYAIEAGTAQAGNSHSITLAATASAVDGTYNRNLIILTDNTGVGQTRTIVDYNGTTKVAVIDRDWRTSPDATTTYQVTADNTPLVVDQGVAQAGSATTITLRAYASSINDTYLCNVVAIIAGTGRGQARLVGGYVGATKVVTICGDNWITAPDTTSVYVLMPYGTTCTSCIGTYALGLINTECDTALTDYDPPTRTEATSDKDEIITEVNANETKIDALNDISVANIIAGISDGALDLQEMMRIILAATAGKSSGGGTVTLVFRDAADAKARITATVDANGNRTAMTLDGS